MSDLNKAQKGFMITLYILTSFALLVSAFVIYNIVTREKPWTIGVTYATKLTANDNQVNICTVTVHDNSNNNGQALYELQFNSYTDSDGTGVNGFGIQAVGDWSVWNADKTYENYIFDLTNPEIHTISEDSRHLTQNNSFIFGDVYLYYTGDDGTIYYTLDERDLDNYLLIDIDGQFYRLTLKKYSYTAQKDGFWNELFGRTESRTTTYGWFEVFDVIIKSAVSHSGDQDYEEFPLSLLDLSRFFDVEVKNESGQYVPVPDTSENRTYLTIQVEYSKDGVTEASDSKFHQIANSTTWNYYEDLNLNDYWNAYSDIEIDERYINAVFNSTENAYYLTIDEAFSNYLDTLQMSKIEVNINLNNLNYDVYAIDLQNFDFNMESFTIIGTDLEDLEFYNIENCPVEIKLNGGTL